LVLELRAKQGRFGKLKTQEGTEIVETFYLYGLACPEDRSPFPAVVGFASTQIAHYQNFVGRYMGIEYQGPDGKPVRPPLWAHRWRLSTMYEKRKKGEFFGWRITLAEKKPDGTELPPICSLLKRSDPLYIRGRELYELVKGGKAKADHAAAAKAGGEAGVDEEMPF
jgi:hypothetical protein